MESFKIKLDQCIEDEIKAFKKQLFEFIHQHIENEDIKNIFLKNFNKYEQHNNMQKLNFDKSKYIEVELYNISGKEYMIDPQHGIVFSGKRADIVEILSNELLQKLRLEHSY